MKDILDRLTELYWVASNKRRATTDEVENCNYITLASLF